MSTPARVYAEARDAARARSRQLAGELTRLGVPAEGAPGGDRAGVWLDGGGAELIIRVMKRCQARGEIVTREHFGLPPAVPVPDEFAPDPEHQPDMGWISEQMLDDAVAAYEARSELDSRRMMAAALPTWIMTAPR